MPHKNIWVRKEDLEAFEAIEDFPEWLHENLSQSTEPKSKESPRSSNDGEPRVPLSKQAIEEANTPKPKTISERIVEKSAGFCPNGHSIPPGRSRCMGKKCKYS